MHRLQRRVAGTQPSRITRLLHIGVPRRIHPFVQRFDRRNTRSQSSNPSVAPEHTRLFLPVWMSYSPSKYIFHFYYIALHGGKPPKSTFHLATRLLSTTQASESNLPFTNANWKMFIVMWFHSLLRNGNTSSESNYRRKSTWTGIQFGHKTSVARSFRIERSVHKCELEDVHHRVVLQYVEHCEQIKRMKATSVVLEQ